MEVVKVTVYGKVQGIGYRYFVQKYAKMLGLKGYVRNLPKNKVEALFVGDQADINKMIEIMKNNHPLARVERMEVEKMEVEASFPDFEILF